MELVVHKSKLKLSGKQLHIWEKEKSFFVSHVVLMSKICVTHYSEYNNVEKNFIVIQVD